MAADRMNEVIRHLHRAASDEQAALTDGQLLEAFVGARNDEALAALVHRHGPMVWGVCRRVLPNHHDAEDAFQATFLVLVRKADSVRPREMLANWLYGVARQTALKARGVAAKRGARERQVPVMPEPESAERVLWDALQPLLDQELGGLPEKYRAVIVLCDLEERTRAEAARQLNLPEGTVSSRLARAREMLAGRLARHGLPVSGGALAAALSHGATSAGVPTAVMTSTLTIASLSAADGLIPAKVSALTEGVVRAMHLAKLKVATAVLLAGVVAAGGAAIGYSAVQGGAGQAREDPPPVTHKGKDDEPPRKATEDDPRKRKTTEVLADLRVRVTRLAEELRKHDGKPDAEQKRKTLVDDLEKHAMKELADHLRELVKEVEGKPDAEQKRKTLADDLVKQVNDVMDDLRKLEGMRDVAESLRWALVDDLRKPKRAENSW